MDRITESLLKEFSDKNGISLLSEDKRFEHFASYLVVTAEHSETFDTHDIIVRDSDGDGGSDTGLDGIAIIVNGHLITDIEELQEQSSAGYLDVSFLFIQAETSSSFDGAKIGTFGFGVVDFFRDKPQLTRNSKVTAATEIMKAIYDESPRFKRGNPVAKLFYLTTGKWGDDPYLMTRMGAVTTDLTNTALFKSVEFKSFGADRVQKMYQRAKNAIHAEFLFEKRVTVSPEIPQVAEAHFGFIPWSEFKKIIADELSNKLIPGLFFDNVRDWQDYNDVNSEIKQTLGSANRGRFVLMNNGITIIAKTVLPTGNKFYIEDYQIVNGCQTTNVLFDQMNLLDDTVTIPIRLISTKDEDVTNAVIKATNRQTEVKEEQLFALQQFSKNLEAYFIARTDPERLYFERRDRQYAALNIEKARIVTFSNAIRAFAGMFLNEPHRTTRNFKGLKGRLGKDIFSNGHKLEPYYVASLSLYTVDYLFRTGRLHSKYRPAKYNILLAFRILVAGYEMPAMTANKMEAYSEKIIAVLRGADAAEWMMLTAAGLVETAAASNFDRDNIRTEPFTEKVLELAKDATKIK